MGVVGETEQTGCSGPSGTVGLMLNDTPANPTLDFFWPAAAGYFSLLFFSFLFHGFGSLRRGKLRWPSCDPVASFIPTRRNRRTNISQTRTGDSLLFSLYDAFLLTLAVCVDVSVFLKRRAERRTNGTVELR